MLKQLTRLVGTGVLLALVCLTFVDMPALAAPALPVEAVPSVLARPPAQGGITLELCASAGSTTVAGATIPIWGFSEYSGGQCGPAQLPGPVLRVPAGAQVTIILHNQLNRNTSINLPGQTITAMTGVDGTFTREAAPGGTASYTFIAANPGTFMYESGSQADLQIPMGLYGALIVEHPSGNQAYDAAESAFDREAVLVLSEIDPNLNANPDGFHLPEYHPIYWLINGKAYPDTAPLTVYPGERLLVRYANGGAVHHTMSLLGVRELLVGKNGYGLSAGAQQVSVVAETIPAGETADAVIAIPATAGGQQFPLFNRQLHLTNGLLPVGDTTPQIGGMMTFIQVLDTLNFNNYTLASYDPTQDVNATATIEDGGATLHLEGNGWKKIPFAYNVVNNAGGRTVLEFDFMSTAEGEIHGIGFDNDDTINNPIRVFQLFGTQNWGLDAFHNYTTADGWKHYKIPVGQFYTGAMTHLVFTNDHDVPSPTANSYFRNIRVYEEPPPALVVNGTPYVVDTYGGAQDEISAVSIENGGTTLRITGNGWKKIDLGAYNITPATVLEFDFESTVQGEIHGIGFDTDNSISANQTFQLYGSQAWGIQAYHNYDPLNGVTHYSIPVGTFFTGSMNYLVFVMDDDANKAGESVFRNITITN
ncbi:MAG: multicopper oxidase family protein [Chloroflexi bacterium]|nr:MAG: multicopper oxidase family protein [Chloroflexota bacterium]